MTCSVCGAGHSHKGTYHVPLCESCTEEGWKALFYDGYNYSWEVVVDRERKLAWAEEAY
ncbi:MAG: hypothetical protein GF409_07395 [Candidatus Omnitrophica bacterium]|nr:hypothetical protein [Candidatus Omnitrophota bacterium]